MTLVKFCTNCGTKISDLAGACSRCASFPFDHACSACGAVIVAGSRFCGSCGNLASRGSGTLKMARPLVTEWAPEFEDAVSERREVTVIFVDVTDFTSVSESLDNEDVYNFIDEAMKLLAGVISDYEGTIDKFTGDGLMAVFGVPQAHENHAERAVRAAWEMQRAVEALRKRLRAQYGFDFRLRIGIHTGDVVAGRLGSSVHSEYTVIGDTVNLAARLEAAAEPDTVYVSSTTYERTAANIRYERVGPLNLKGGPAARR